MRKSEGYIISSTDSTDVNCFDSSQLHQKTVSTLEMETVQALLHLQNSQKKDKNIQVTSGDLVAPFISTLKSDNDLNTMAGIPSFLLFNAIVANCEMFGKFCNKHKLNLKERVLLTFMKLKNTFSYAVLAVLFKTVTAIT
ncbi:hypothetical protein Zmor_007082 [Zophobas morio]|uniref:Uncharacterized protein n=1 Tax=Zophobas morio TaxID=2755281 RepID=A0AA38MNZ6_9CUCU|nr:hypothetical protein Zmor_007082 [Zophobas morio]